MREGHSGNRGTAADPAKSPLLHPYSPRRRSPRKNRPGLLTNRLSPVAGDLFSRLLVTAFANRGRGAYLKGRPDTALPAVQGITVHIPARRPSNTRRGHVRLHTGGSIPQSSQHTSSVLAFHSKDGGRDPPPSFHPQMVKTGADSPAGQRTEKGEPQCDKRSRSTAATHERSAW